MIKICLATAHRDVSLRRHRDRASEAADDLMTGAEKSPNFSFRDYDIGGFHKRLQVSSILQICRVHVRNTNSSLFRSQNVKNRP